MLTWLAVVAGGAIGSAARYGVNLAAFQLLGSASPYATAAVNLIGSLVIGLLAGLLDAQRLSMSINERALVFTGLLGGFTTFSSLMHDGLLLWQIGATSRAIVNLLGQLVVGCILVYAGYRLGAAGAAD